MYLCVVNIYVFFVLFDERIYVKDCFWLRYLNKDIILGVEYIYEKRDSNGMIINIYI